MSDLIADLRQKLADWGDNAELRLAIERDEWGVTTLFVSRVDAFGDDEPAWDRADTLDPLIVAAVNALPGLLDELEAARWLIDALPPEPRTWGIRYVQARAANG